MRGFNAIAFQLSFTIHLVGLKLNETHLLLAYADDVNQLGDNINIINRNKEALIDANRKLV
jgi:hypothetical protein